MRTAIPGRIGAALGVCAFSLLLVVIWLKAAAVPQPASAALIPVPVLCRQTYEGALREARAWRLVAREAVKPELEAAEAAFLEPLDGLNTERLRRRLMAGDQSGSLRRARVAARAAAALARTPAEASRVAELLVMIECDAGCHDRELLEAQKMVALQPRSPRSLMALRRAATCNGMKPLRREATAALEALEERTADSP